MITRAPSYGHSIFWESLGVNKAINVVAFLTFQLAIMYPSESLGLLPAVALTSLITSYAPPHLRDFP